jgi:glucose/arabinose dehydrogenase
MGGLLNPNNIDYNDGWFYIGEENRVIRVRETAGHIANMSTLQVLIDNLPSGQGHFTRTVLVHNNSLFISIGSSCNVCHEADARRATIQKCSLNGSNCTLFARGLRNSVGMEAGPNGAIYATDNGRDYLGDDLPPDEINLIEEGNNYGWPICYGKNIHDTQFDNNTYIRNPCMEPFESESLVDLQAHSAPLGLAFYNATSFLQQYQGKLFVAFHGSWNRMVPTGYKVVAVDTNTYEVSDFAAGWLTTAGVAGRPVDVLISYDGSLLVSDDYAGKIYRITYGEQ